MKIDNSIFRELVKRGYSLANENKVWDMSESKVWYITPELSEGFLNLENYFPYRMKVIDTEFDLINQNAKTIAKNVGSEPFNLIDLGCGNGKKAAAFIKTIPENVKIRYCPVDVSKFFLRKAEGEVRKLGRTRKIEVKPILSDFKDFENIIGMVRSPHYQRNVILFLGETISHYEVSELLYNLSDPMWKSDMIIIGNGYRVGERFVELDKYKHKLFNDWFIHVMRGLGFKESEVGYAPRFRNGRLEFGFILKKNKKVNHKRYEINFKKGDQVIVGCQYKYFENEWKEFFDLYFSDIEQLKDLGKEYALYICRK